MIINLDNDKELSMEEVRKNIESFTYPIFQKNHNKYPELVASCVAVELAGKHFLCTAAHAFKYLDTNIGRIYSFNSNVSKKRSLVELELNGIFTKEINGINFDLCLISVDEIKDNFKFLNETQITRDTDFSNSSFQVLMGYPLSRNKPNKAINLKSKRVKTSYHTTQVKLDSGINFPQFNKIENVHIAFRYNVGVGVSGKSNSKGKLVYPKGMSGGGVWNVPTIFNPNKIYLTGIFIEY